MILVIWTWAWIDPASTLCFVVGVLLFGVDKYCIHVAQKQHYDCYIMLTFAESHLAKK